MMDRKKSVLNKGDGLNNSIKKYLEAIRKILYLNRKKNVHNIIGSYIDGERVLVTDE